jgi:hypothetical protein
MQKNDVIQFLRGVAVSMSKNKKRQMQEVIAIIAGLWGDRDTESILQSVNTGFQRLLHGFGEVSLNQRSLQLTLKKWEQLAINKGWVTKDDLQEAADMVNAEIEAQEKARLEEMKKAQVDEEHDDVLDGEIEEEE